MANQTTQTTVAAGKPRRGPFISGAAVAASLAILAGVTFAAMSRSGGGTPEPAVQLPPEVPLQVPSLVAERVPARTIYVADSEAAAEQMRALIREGDAILAGLGKAPIGDFVIVAATPADNERIEALLRESSAIGGLAHEELQVVRVSSR